MTTFPLTMDKHIAFCVIGFIFFMIQFFRQGYKYQIISAFAIASTLLLYINDSQTWRYGVGILELVLIIAIFIVMSVEKKKAEQKELEAQKNKTESEAVAETAAETAITDAEAAETANEAAEVIAETAKKSGDEGNE